MALPLGKLTLIVGAGLAGSILAKEGRISDVSGFFSGAFKILKKLQRDDPTISNPKPKNDSLLQQVNSLREELQLLASSRSVTIVTSKTSGSGKYGVVIVIVVVGYGYIWWKGWKLSDMMFATRRGLNDACASVGKQLEGVYTSISATKRHLSSRIDRVDCKIDECVDDTTATKEEVSELRGEVKLIGADVHSVHHVVRSLVISLYTVRIEGRQNETNFGVGKLVAYVRNLENNRPVEQIEGAASSSSRPALELPQVSPSKAASLPANSSIEPPSPSDRSNKHLLQNTISASGLKDLYEISDGVGVSSLSTPRVSNGVHSSEDTNNDIPGSGMFGRTFSGISASFLSRNRSVKQSFK
ncbi:uncharacterized protein LOC111406226 isoform X1 [Olea europaea var. sylvestris]|uniref:uncharacterized protein LOC111406226 isoform X1 n=1 Tax=Olea europaea var. sylvestris TaxID=158386 RepID=UPI000C1D10B7|nr:uncharacterized protein LOC111406226 isoform X1 [Olea europaea var. sylvestris]